jgi:hypothetical protein
MSSSGWELTMECTFTFFLLFFFLFSACLSDNFISLFITHYIVGRVKLEASGSLILVANTLAASSRIQNDDFVAFLMNVNNTENDELFQ